VSANERAKDFDDLGAMLEAFDDGKHVAERFGETSHGGFGGIEGGVKFPQSMGNLLEEKNDLDADDGSDDGEDGDREKTDYLGQGHRFSIAS